MSDILSRIRGVYAEGKERQVRKNEYTVNRQLSGERHEGSYVTDLPSIEGQNVINLLDEMQRKGINGKILDVGCGNGNFLASLSEKYGSQFQYDGLTMFPYHDENRMKALKVNIDIGNVQKIVRRNTYDIIVAEHSLEYAENPLLALKRIYDDLKPGGVGLLYPLTVHFVSDAEKDKFVSYLSQHYGFSFTEGIEKGWQPGWKVAFRKTKDRLTLPVSIAGIKDVGNEYTELKQVEYHFDKNENLAAN